jgi:hypothetical protein
MHDSQSLILDDLLQNPLYIEEVFGIHKLKCSLSSPH